MLDRYADLAVVLAVTFSYSAVHPGPLAWMAGLGSISGFLMASYVTKEFAVRHGRAYPSGFPNRIKRRDLRMLGISVGAVLGLAFEAMVALGALSHLCVVGILIRGWRQGGHPEPAPITGVSAATSGSALELVQRLHRRRVAPTSR